MHRNFKFDESTVFQKSIKPAFYIVKYHRFDKDWYIGEDGLAENFEEAKTFSSCSEAEEGIEEFITGLDIPNELGYDVEEMIDQEKKYWGDQYEREEKKISGLIDELPAIESLKSKMEIKGVFSSKYEEKRTVNKMREGSEKDIYSDERLDDDWALSDSIFNYLIKYYYTDSDFALKETRRVIDFIKYGLALEPEEDMEESLSRKKANLKESNNMSYLVTIACKYDEEDLDDFTDYAFPQMIEDANIPEGQYRFEYGGPSTLWVRFKQKNQAMSFVKLLNKNLFKVKLYNMVDKIINESKEDHLVTRDFYAGPGRIEITKADKVYDDEVIPDKRYLKEIDSMAKYDFKTDLAKYFRGQGIKSMKFERMEIIDDNYYMVWRVVYNPEVISEKKIKDYLSGQMSDGWGEGFEQAPFRSYWDRYGERVDYYYSPWTTEGFEIRVEEV